MTFLVPVFLVALLAVAALAGLYVWLQSRRRHYAVRFTNVDLLASVAPKRPGWRRHLPAAIVGLALALLVIGLAQPVHATAVAEESKIIMLTIDVSRSMEATDVAPSRLAAAEAAAEKFVNELPDGIEVGLVSYAGTASLLVPPTDDHQVVANAVSSLQPEDGTAAGSGIMTSLQSIARAQAAAEVEHDNSSTAPSAAIVLLSDGASELGVPLATATVAAAQANVPVSTITFGTETGTVMLADGQDYPVPPDAAAMAQVARATGGTAFDADSAEQLDKVYSQIQGEVGSTLQEVDLWPWFVGIALLLLLTACAAAMFWNARFL